MKNICKLFVMLLALCMTLCLCACQQDPAGTEDTQGTTTDPAATTTVPAVTTTAPEGDGKVTYTVTVTDEEGNPIAGAMIQMCKDACVPAVTNTKGVAEYYLPRDTYKVSFLTLPAGYTYSTEATEFYFADGETALTIALKAAQ